MNYTFLALGMLPSAVALSCLATSSFATPREVVVTAHRYETAAHTVGSSLTVISEEEIAQSQARSVAELLLQVPSVSVVQSGGPGGNAAVFMRGANSEHTLVLIDGIEANNPVSTNRAFNFSDLTLDNVERIEILRGPQSTLYGSDAMGGVISIITKRGRGAPTATLSFEAGTYQSFTEKVAVSGAHRDLDFSLAASRQDTAGISAAAARYGNSETDGYENSSVSGRADYRISEYVQATTIARYGFGRADLDLNGGVGGDDPNRIFRQEQFFARGQFTFEDLVPDQQQTLAFSVADQDFEDNNDFDSGNPFDWLRSRYQGTLLKVEATELWRVTSEFTLLAGIEAKQERASSRYRSQSAFGPFDSDFGPFHVRTTGYFGQAALKLTSDWDVVFGGRLEDHEKFGTESTWRASSSYRLGDTRFFSSIGTGYKAPSLYQLYSNFGNQELSPEKSLGFDLGVEQKVSEGATVAATFFWNSFDQLISFEPTTFISENIAQARTHGVELSTQWEVTPTISTGLSGTYTEATDTTTNLPLLRRPRVQAALFTSYQYGAGRFVRLEGQVVGRRTDNDFMTFPATRTQLPAYALWALKAEHALHENLALIGRIENTFDKRYESVLGYGAPGFAVYAGLKISLR